MTKRENTLITRKKGENQPKGGAKSTPILCKGRNNVRKRERYAKQGGPLGDGDSNILGGQTGQGHQ